MALLLVMLRPLDARLHYRSPQQLGEYFGKDCGERSVPRGQGHSSGTIRTDQDTYPVILPYHQRQIVTLNEEYITPKKGERPMHATTISYQPVTPQFLSTTKYVSSEGMLHTRVCDM